SPVSRRLSLMARRDAGVDRVDGRERSDGAGMGRPVTVYGGLCAGVSAGMSDGRASAERSASRRRTGHLDGPRTRAGLSDDGVPVVLPRSYAMALDDADSDQ